MLRQKWYIIVRSESTVLQLCL